MLNVHLNGDLVRCPDTREIFKRIAERNLKECRCKYGMEEIKCPAWYQFCKNKDEVKLISQFGRCYLSGCDQCPAWHKRKTSGLKKKNFEITNNTYRKLSSSAHYLVKKHKFPLFITLTFPPFKKYVNDKEINKYFSRFIENLRARHACHGYIAVREFGHKNNRVHFHLLLAMDYISYTRLNNIWCGCISDICSFAKNAVTSDPKTRFIKNPVRAMRYVCKYFSKSKGKPSESRLVFLSENVLIKHKTFDNSNCEFFTINDLFEKYNSLTVCQSSDYTTAFRIEDPAQFSQFCNEYLYKIFNLSDQNSNFRTYLPENSS
jgi:hypothetical protein